MIISDRMLMSVIIGLMMALSVCLASAIKRPERSTYIDGKYFDHCDDSVVIRDGESTELMNCFRKMPRAK